MIIRKAEINDIEDIMQIWMTENIRAHYYISSDYWEANYSAVKNILPQSEIYVSVCDGETAGFIGANDNYIEGIFVKSNHQRKGVGSALLNKLKERKSSLTLNVYKKNDNAVAFYLKNEFSIINENIEENTKESQYLMQWELNSD